MKYTPAPWKVERRFFVTAEIAGRKSSVVCEIDRHAWLKTGEAEANARLIAAAPELLDALKRTTEQLSFLQRAAMTEAGMSVYSMHIQEASEAIKASRAIIQKAEA